MQATLLSIAIALILALVTALVGPHFVDWNKYRVQFETQASRMTGLQVRIAGPIEARLLPTPSMNLSRIEIARGDEAGSLRARRLSIEFSLGSLARGEFKATDVILEGAEIAIALDRNGRLDWPAPSVGFDLEAISIERLDIRDSRALLADAASGYGMVLDKLEFKGELRTLSGPVKGQGSFYADGMHYPYRIAMSRVGDDRLRVRFNIDPIDRPLTFDTEGFLSVENGAPRFAGNVTFARPVTRAPTGSQAEVLEPWRLTGKIDGNSTRAVVEQIEFQYGPDDRPIRLRGDARINFGASPRSHRRAVVAADRSRPHPGVAGAAAPPPARRHQDLCGLLRRIAAAADPRVARRQRRKPDPGRRDPAAVQRRFRQHRGRLGHRETRAAGAWPVATGDGGTPRRCRRHLVRGADTAVFEGSAHADCLADRSSRGPDHRCRQSECRW